MKLNACFFSNRETHFSLMFTSIRKMFSNKKFCEPIKTQICFSSQIFYMKNKYKCEEKEATKKWEQIYWDP